MDNFEISIKDTDFQKQVDVRHAQHLRDGEPIERQEVERALWGALVLAFEDLVGAASEEAARSSGALEAYYNPHEIPHRYSEKEDAQKACERFAALLSTTYHVAYFPYDVLPGQGRPYILISDDDLLNPPDLAQAFDVVFTREYHRGV